MNEELTNEVLEDMEKCGSIACINCAANHIICGAANKTIGKLATALLAERDKPKVWDGAPEDAFQAQITWFAKNGGFTGIKTYTREQPKTRARQIAEEIEEALSLSDRYKPEIKTIESVLKKYAAELGEENKPII